MNRSEVPQGLPAAVVLPAPHAYAGNHDGQLRCTVITRRQLIKTGLTGSLLLAASGCLHRRAARPPAAARAPASEPPFLDPGDRAAVAAIALGMLATVPEIDTLGREPFAVRVTDGVERAILGLTPAVQGELRQLFDLLGFYPTRRLLAGIGSDWAETDDAAIAEFLASWRDSRLRLLNSAYAALHQLVTAAWYGDPLAWASCGYPGPPRIEHG